MPNLKDIKNRIQSVQSTKKITRAMKMVAAAKVKKAEYTVKATRPFTRELYNMFEKLLSSVGGKYSTFTLKVEHAIDNYPKILDIRETKAVGLVVITSNKGLAGAYNANLIKRTLKTIKDYKEKGIDVKLFVVGQKGISGLKKKVKELGVEIEKTYIHIIDKPSPTNTYLLIEDVATLYVNRQIDKIEFITTRFKNMMTYFVENWPILPLQNINYNNKFDGIIESLMEFEPDRHRILQEIVPMYLTNIAYQALLEAQASELASRMTAMSAATTNAEKMLHTLSIEYNKSRQAAITQEIVEVVSGANAQMH